MKFQCRLDDVRESRVDVGGLALSFCLAAGSNATAETAATSSACLAVVKDLPVSTQLYFQGCWTGDSEGALVAAILKLLPVFACGAGQCAVDISRMRSNCGGPGSPAGVGSAPGAAAGRRLASAAGALTGATVTVSGAGNSSAAADAIAAVLALEATLAAAAAAVGAASASASPATYAALVSAFVALSAADAAAAVQLLTEPSLAAALAAAGVGGSLTLVAPPTVHSGGGGEDPVDAALGGPVASRVVFALAAAAVAATAVLGCAVRYHRRALRDLAAAAGLAAPATPRKRMAAFSIVDGPAAAGAPAAGGGDLEECPTPSYKKARSERLQAVAS